MSNTIALAGKGGTGKTTTAGLLIKYLKKTGKTPVLTVDADPNANLNEVLGLEVTDTLGQAREEMKGGKVPSGMTKDVFIAMRLEQAIMETGDFDLVVMGQPEGSGCYCAANTLLTNFLDRLSDNYPYVVVDNEAGMEHISRMTTKNIDVLLIVTDASRRGLQAGIRIHELTRSLNICVGRSCIILNQSKVEPSEEILKLIRDAGIEYIGSVPADDLVYEFDFEGRPMIELPEDSAVVQAAFAAFETSSGTKRHLFMIGPYSNLFIYYIRGRISSRLLFGSRFLGNWQEDDTAFLFFTETADERIDSLVAARSDLDLIDRFEMTYSDWHGGDIQPFTAGKFRVAPPWSETAGRNRDSDILLDPGLVFGAGTHPTTRDCMEAIEAVFEQGPVSATLDLGTGTGLLALEAAHLGCPRVLAVDKNYLAVRTTRDNIRLNRMGGRALAVQGCAEDFMEISADLLIANIHYDVMNALVDAPGFLQKKWFVLSGLLRSEARKIEDPLHAVGATVVARWNNEGVWHTFLGRN